MSAEERIEVLLLESRRRQRAMLALLLAMATAQIDGGRVETWEALRKAINAAKEVEG